MCLHVDHSFFDTTDMSKLVPKQTEWNLSSLFKAGDNDPAMASEREILTKQATKFIDKWQPRDDYLTDPEVLTEALVEYENWSAMYGAEGNEGFYFWLRTSQDQLSSELKAKNQLITNFGLDVGNRIQFFELKIAKIEPKLHAKFLSHPKLAAYKHYLERAFEAAQYLLSEPEEKILNLKSSPAYYNWVKMTSSFLSGDLRDSLTEDGQRQPMSYEQLVSLVSSNNKAVRDQAAETLNAILADHADVAENEINSILANKKIDDELRGFERPDSSRHLGDDVETAMVDALIKAVSDRNDIAQRFYKLKAKLLGLPKLAYHERNIEYGELGREYSYEEALRLVHEVYSRLDPDFGAILEDYVSNGKIDVYPRKGKSGGAFCVDILISQPTFVLLNFTNKTKDVTTLAHEMGHALHSEYRRRHQTALSFQIPMATAEVASQYTEDFVMDELVAQADDELKLAIQMSRLNDAVSSIFRQIACYKFELAIHTEFREKGYLSKEAIGQLFQNEMVAYMGEAVEQSPGSENWWVYWSHIRNFFYVYAYAGGLLIGKAMQNATRKDAKFVEKVKQFLAAGSSKSPAQIFADMDIDITDAKFWNQGLDEIEALLVETEALAKRLNKI